MKVVINDCYGGFGVSCDALLELVKRGSKIVKENDAAEWNGIGWVPFRDGYSRTKTCSLIRKDGKVYFIDGNDDVATRSNADLIAVVEALGDGANDVFASLKIIDVPDDRSLVIEEYDGREWVAEKHETWS